MKDGRILIVIDEKSLDLVIVINATRLYDDDEDIVTAMDLANNVTMSNPLLLIFESSSPFYRCKPIHKKDIRQDTTRSEKMR